MGFVPETALRDLSIARYCQIFWAKATAYSRLLIAGATCKKCQKQDVIRWCKNNDTEQEWIECVSCGYHEDKPDEVMNAEHPQPSSDGIVNIVRFK